MNKKILIQIAPRFLKADSFWFTFFHELGHVFLHTRKLDFTDLTDMPQNDAEQEADEFARDVLIPRKYLSEIESLKGQIYSN